MSELQNAVRKRNVAIKVKVSDIAAGNLVRDGVSSPYVKISGIAASRINIIAVLVYKSEESGYASAIIDDGSGRVSLRAFEDKNMLSKVDVGDIVLVVGRIREFGSEVYVLPEILKRLADTGWANVRKLELERILSPKKMGAEVEKVHEESSSANYRIYSLIKEIDTGEGVSVDDIIKISGIVEAERALNMLLENGDVFEVKPGKLKVLE